MSFSEVGALSPQEAADFDLCEMIRAPVFVRGKAGFAALAEGLRLLRAGAVRKRFAATRMNERSSRAHCVVCLRARQTRGDAMVSSTLHLVDLAGSERIKKSGATARGSARKAEAVGINGSLLVLGMALMLKLWRAHRRRGAGNPRRWLTMGAMPAGGGGGEGNAKHRAEKAMAALDEMDAVEVDGVTSGTR